MTTRYDKERILNRGTRTFNNLNTFELLVESVPDLSG